MDMYNRTIVSLYKKANDIPPGKRRNFVDKVKRNFDKLGLFSRSDIIEASDIEFNTAPLFGSEEWIRNKREELGIDECDVEVENETEAEVSSHDKYKIFAYGRTEAHEAVSANDVDMLKSLVENDRTIFEVRDNNGDTPIHLAARNGKMNLIKLFREFGLVS